MTPGYQLSDDKADLQIDVIHAFLSSSYWSPGIPRDVVVRAIEGSHSVGIFREADGAQVAFARVITDHATFAYLADVFVVEEARGMGLAAAMIAYFDGHPDLQGLRRWMLVTRDAHGLYERFGYALTDEALRIMVRRDPDVYLRRAHA